MDWNPLHLEIPTTPHLVHGIPSPDLVQQRSRGRKDWQDGCPSGVVKVIRSETELLIAIYRTQLFNPGDLDNVKEIQARYSAQPLSAFLGQLARNAAPIIEFHTPPTTEEIRTSPKVLQVLSFLLQLCPTHPSETELLTRFATIGVGAGKTFDPRKLSPELAQAVDDAISDAWATDFADLGKRISSGCYRR